LIFKLNFIKIHYMKKLVKVKVSGKLQKIGYRFQVLQMATDLGITGFIRQESDNSIYLEAEGEEEELKKFMRFCKSGVDKAMVTDFQYESAEPVDHHGFTFGDYTVSDHYKKKGE